jgi:hypothetical protein
MEKVISCCGLNCATCTARIATLTNDNELRKDTAEKWKVAYAAADLSFEMINCTGCREDGVKFAHCHVCEIRKCADTKQLRTCGKCSQINSCSTVDTVHKYVPEAILNLKGLN